MKKWGMGLMVLGVIVTSVGIVGLLLDDGGKDAAVPAADASAAADDEAPPAPDEGAEEPDPAEDPLTVVRSLYDDLEQAVAAGDVAGLVERLHPAVVQVYGQEQCREHLAAFAAAGPSFEVVSASAPEPFTFDRDGAGVAVGDAYSAEIAVSAGGEDIGVQEAHVAEADGSLRWFTDCGEPV